MGHLVYRTLIKQGKGNALTLIIDVSVYVYLNIHTPILNVVMNTTYFKGTDKTVGFILYSLFLLLLASFLLLHKKKKEMLLSFTNTSLKNFINP